MTLPDQGLPPKPADALPDSTEPNGPCPRCGRVSNFGRVGSLPLSFNSSVLIGPDNKSMRDHDEQVTVLGCPGCNQGVVVIEEKYVGGRAARSGGNSGVIQWRGIHWWPSPGMKATAPDIPAAVGEAMAEGTRCLAIQAPRAAVVMFRGALAEIVTDRGSATAQGKHSLAGQLKQMGSEGALDNTLADWADHIRVIGNAGAHPNTLAPVSIKEAEELARLLASLLDYLYIMPAKVRRARSGRP